MLKKIISLFVIVLVLTSSLNSALAKEIDVTPTKDLLLITENQVEYDESLLTQALI